MSASKIIRPAIEYLDSYIEALDEYHQEDRYMYQDGESIRANAEEFMQIINTETGNPYQPLQDWADHIPETVLWFVKDTMYVGSIDIRHRLNWHLERWGGHISFRIRPSERRKGYGKKILKKAIPVMNYIGIEKALLTVNPENEAAIATIEACGGVLEDTTQDSDQFPSRLRYWLDCT